MQIRTCRLAILAAVVSLATAGPTGAGGWWVICATPHPLKWQAAARRAGTEGPEAG